MDNKTNSNVSSSTETKLPRRNSLGLKGENHQQNGEAITRKPQTLSHQALSMDDATTPNVGATSNFTKLSIGVLIGGVSLGLILPKNENLLSRSWQILSNVIGYTYFLAWSTSFYPQIFLNYERRTTHGLSVDFCVLNVLGYVCYTIYCTSFYFNQSIISEYKNRMSAVGNDNVAVAQVTVQGNDVAFAIHAVIMASFTLSQIRMYDTFAARPPSKRIYAILALIFVYCAIYIGGTLILKGQADFLGFLYVLGSIKIGVTIGKYVPQALLNRSRKSTVGWNVWNVILDFTGGVLSFIQLIGDCADMNDWSGISGNPAKIMLALVTICFDVIFLVQHYILYPDAEEKQSYSSLPENQSNHGVNVKTYYNVR